MLLPNGKRAIVDVRKLRDYCLNPDNPRAATRKCPATDNLLCQKEEAIMSKKKIKLLDTVALLEDLPERGLKRGEVGTVVELLAPDVYEVEFCDEEGQTYAELALRGELLVPLHNQGEGLKIVA